MNSYGLAPTTPSRWRVYRFHHLGVYFETNILQLPPATTSWPKHLPLEGSLLSVWKNWQSRHCLPFGPFGLYCTSIWEPPRYHFGRGGRTRTLDPRFWRPLLWPTELHPCLLIQDITDNICAHPRLYRLSRMRQGCLCQLRAAICWMTRRAVAPRITSTPWPPRARIRIMIPVCPWGRL